MGCYTRLHFLPIHHSCKYIQYAPNYDDPQFFHNIFFNLTSCPGETFIGGDFNLVLNPVLDRSSAKQTTLTQAAKALKVELRNFGLCDIWRRQNHLPGNTLSTPQSMTATQESIFSWFLWLKPIHFLHVNI